MSYINQNGIEYTKRAEEMDDLMTRILEKYFDASKTGIPIRK
jgi:hypothetical protein